MYLVFCITLELEEDKEKTYETTRIRVICVVPLFYTGPPALYTLYKSLYSGAIFIVTKILLYHTNLVLFFIMETPEGINIKRSRGVGDAGRCSKQSSKKKRFAGINC